MTNLKECALPHVVHHFDLELKPGVFIGQSNPEYKADFAKWRLVEHVLYGRHWQ